MKAVMLAVFAIATSQAIAQTSDQSAAANDAAAKPALGTWGIDLSNMDKSVKPGDDFYRYVNGGWLAENHIPEDRASWGSFAELQKLSHKANDSLDRIGRVVDRVEDVSLSAARVAAAVGGLTRVGQYAGLAVGLKRGVEVFLDRIKDRRH